MLQRISDGPATATLTPQYGSDAGPYTAGISIAGIFNILRRRMSIVAITAFVVVLLTIVFIFAVRPSYTATATVLIDPHRSDVINLNDTSAALRNSSTDEAAVQSQVLLMQSVEVMRRVVKTLNLTQEPDFSPQPGLLDPLKKLFSSSRKTGGQSEEDIAVLNSVAILEKRLR